MKFLLKLARNGLGGVIAFIARIIPVIKVKRTLEGQAKIDKQTKNLELYQFFGCPFCIKTRRAIRRLNLNIEKRNAQGNTPYRQELLDSGGKVQVPCLKITDGENTTWMYEANNIIKYLEENYGK
jgi:glutaredoxin